MEALVIDDETDIGLLVCRFLKREEIGCHQATTIAEATAQLNNSAFDIFFLDINLPDGNGLNLLPLIKRSCPHCKVFVISAYQHDDEKKKAFELGADQFMSKPFSKKQILSLLSSED